jgi:hypothetical protein
MLEYIVANSDRIVAIVALVSGLAGWYCRSRRSEKKNMIILDAFSGSTIYSMFYLLIVLWFLDQQKASEALIKQSEMLIITFSAGLIYFIRDYVDTVIKGT